MQFNVLTIALAIFLGSAAAAPNNDIADTQLEVLPEFNPDGLPIIDLRGSQGLSKRANCASSPGVANGACVRYFRSDGQCSGGDNVSYKPTCQGNCYVDNFQSVSLAGDGTYGTACELFLDNQCQQKVVDTGNVVTGPARCARYSGKSMRCYYRC